MDGTASTLPSLEEISEIVFATRYVEKPQTITDPRVIAALLMQRDGDKISRSLTLADNHPPGVEIYLEDNARKFIPVDRRAGEILYKEDLVKGSTGRSHCDRARLFLSPKGKEEIIKWFPEAKKLSF